MHIQLITVELISEKPLSFNQSIHDKEITDDIPISQCLATR